LVCCARIALLDSFCLLGETGDGLRFGTTRLNPIAGLAGRVHLPMIYPFRDYADSGGLMSYAPDLGELAERLAVDVHQILRGPSRAKSQATGPTDSSWLSI
jgi:hypothetical protein